MRLTAIDQAIQVCDEHLLNTNSKGTEIEAFLTRYLLILICAHFEEKIEQIIVDRAKQSNDKYLISYVQSSISQIFRSIKTSEISGLLNRFGIECKNKFQAKVVGQPEETYFNNLITNRHSTAHSSGSNLTFDELVKYYESGHQILDYIKDALI